VNIAKTTLRILGCLLFLLLAGLSLQRLRSIVPERGTPSLQDIVDKAEANPFNPHNWYILGSVYAYDLSSTSLEKSARSFSRAAQLNPWFWKYWAELANVLENSGRPEAACQVLAMARQLNRSYIPFYWNAANMYLRHGRFADAAACFRRNLEGNPGRVDAVLELCWKAFPDRELIVDQVIPDRADLLNRALRWSIGKNDEHLSRRCWDRLLDLPDEFSIHNVFQYCGFRLKQQDFEGAWRDWLRGLRRSFPHRHFPEDEPVFNGNFEYSPLGGGFGWICYRDQGIRWKLDRLHRYQDFHAMRFSFDGSRNFSGSVLRQIVYVPAAGRYTLHYAVLSELSTDQGLYFSILRYTDYPRLTEVARGEHHADDPVWRAGEIPFTVDEDNTLLEIRLQRDRSFKIDNQVKGDLWIDDVYLTREPE
jgi:tetratricopeptide (TPR) repeat protein